MDDSVSLRLGIFVLLTLLVGLGVRGCVPRRHSAPLEPAQRQSPPVQATDE